MAPRHAGHPRHAGRPRWPAAVVVVVTALAWPSLPMRAAAPAPRPWVEVTSPHFTVISDAGEKRAARAAWQFEQVRAVLGRLWPWARLATGKPVVIFAARDENTMKALAPAFWEVKGGIRPAGVFVTGPDRHYVAVRTDIEEPDSVQANPYYASYWSYVFITLQASFGRELPMWLGRGLSDLFANTIVRDKDIQVGRVIPWYLKELRDQGRLRLQAVLGADYQSRQATREDEARAFDASAWVLVHYLGFGESGANLPKLNQFLELVSKGSDVNAALVDVYGPLDRLDGTLQNYIDRTMYTYKLIGLDVHVSADGFTARPLAAAEAAASRGMFLAVSRRPAEARRLTQEAAQAAPGLPVSFDVDGMVADLDGQRDAALAAYAKACELGSTNFYSYFRHAQLLWKPTLDRSSLEEMAKLLGTSVKLNPSWAPGYSFLAEVQTDLGEADTALGMARRAIALEPGASSPHGSAARALARLSRLDEAIKEAERALALARTQEERQHAQDLLARFKQIAKRP